ncbi:MAG: hypothetical protein A2252_05370 [Elusimicrobia bacterium RIFOXYA2_FULL_39_19]|nr:MAG: hypothetical protein A2252_05370 [Elusimicrobia bacterium RIFOXYA2_FULL_39_19]
MTKIKTINKLLSIFKKESSFLITGHINPDGDTVGSALALASWLKKLKKDVIIVISDPVPDNLQFLPGINLIKNEVPENKHYDTGIMLECPDITRISPIIKLAAFKKTVNIDHHIESAERKYKTDCELIDSKASSCCEMIFEILQEAKHKITSKEAECLYTGILTDTGRFQYSNTTPKTMSIVSRLLERNIDTIKVFRNIYATKSLKSILLLGRILNTLETNSGVSYMKITNEMFKHTGTTQKDSEEAVNYAGMVPGTKIYALFREMDGNKKERVKVSLRSYEKINVFKIAGKYGGGGHFHASGFELPGSIQEVTDKIIPVLIAEAQKAE